jgi:hypothetical protein
MHRDYTVIISQPDQPLTIVDQPSDQTDCYGNTVEFSVTLDGAVGSILYQWQSASGGSFPTYPEKFIAVYCS